MGGEVRMEGGGDGRKHRAMGRETLEPFFIQLVYHRHVENRRHAGVYDQCLGSTCCFWDRRR